MATAAIEHIEVDEKGIARVAGSRSKVSQIAIDTMMGLTPADIHREYPHLSLAQIHAALAYYYDHQAEVDAQIAAGHRLAEEARLAAGEPPFVTRLKAEGTLP